MTNLPVTGSFTITAVFGQSGKYWKNGHKGIDFVAENKNVYCTCDGVVRVVGFDKNGWGNYVSVGDGFGRKHIFCHLDKVLVKEGEKLSRTSVIGIMGATGNVSGLHLHYQINDGNNIPVDPSGYMGLENKKGSYNSKEFNAMAYNDQHKISDWAKKSVARVTELGLMVGDENGNFNPEKNITRQEVAAVISRLVDIVKE